MLVWDTQALNMRVVLCPDSGKANSMDAKGYTAQGDRGSLAVQRPGSFLKVLLKHPPTITSQSEITEQLRCSSMLGSWIFLWLQIY